MCYKMMNVANIGQWRRYHFVSTPTTDAGI